MRGNFVSTLAAIALAVPLGIGGLTITAPATATDAHANVSSWDDIAHHFLTCSVDVSWRCHERIQAYVARWGKTFGYTARALPSGSNGADQPAYDYLRNRIDSGTLHPWTRALWEDGFNTIFPDGVIPSESPDSSGGGEIVTQLQITAIEPFDASRNQNPFSEEEGEVVSQHRESIVELQDEVSMHEERITAMLEVQGSLATQIRLNTGGIAALNSRVDAFGDDIQKNTAGIALAYAFPSSGLNYNESFRLSGGAGYFREEAAVAFGFTGRLSQNVTASGGVGLADGVSGARIEVGYGW